MQTQEASGSASDLLALRPLPEYRQSREHVFRSVQSLQWFVRCNKARLVDAGALIMLSGRWHVVPSRFDAIVLEAGQAAAKNQAAA